MDKRRTLFGFAVGVGLLAAASARADHVLECDKVQLPSSLVICSESELLAIADERGQVYRELWARLDAAQRAALQADQARWVGEYATRCGVPPDRPPELPPIPSVVDCFKQAGRARIAFLRGYSPISANSPIPPGRSSDDEVLLAKSGGTYMVPVLLNGLLPLPFVVDSGAADVSLPADVVATLFRTGTIRDNDYIGEAKYELADGSLIDSPRFFLEEVRVGNHAFHHVLASLAPVKSTPLLGQSFLSKIGVWSIDNERHVLVLGSTTTTAGADAWVVPPISPIPPVVSETPQAAAFQDGLRDRLSWERWFVRTAGSFKDGADYWAGQRSLPNPGSCYPSGHHLGDWTTGCLAAKRLLDPTDVRRKSEPEYRAGWNSYHG